MTLETYTTHDFIEIKVDEITTTIFKDSKEIDDVILNLLDVIDDLTKYTDKTLEDFISV